MFYQIPLYPPLSKGGVCKEGIMFLVPLVGGTAEENLLKGGRPKARRQWVTTRVTPTKRVVVEPKGFEPSTS